MNNNTDNSPGEHNKPTDGFPLWFEPAVKFIFFGLVLFGLGPVTILNMYYGMSSPGWIDQYLVIWGYITFGFVALVLPLVLGSRGFSPDDFSIQPKSIQGCLNLIFYLDFWLTGMVLPMAGMYWFLKGWRWSMSKQILLAVLTIVIPLGIISFLYRPSPE